MAFCLQEDANVDDNKGPDADNLNGDDNFLDVNVLCLCSMSSVNSAQRRSTVPPCGEDGRGQV